MARYLVRLRIGREPCRPAQTPAPPRPDARPPRNVAQSPIGVILASAAVCAAWSCSRGSNSFGSFRSWSGRAPRRACSALVRWPYPWRSPSGTRIPATGAAKPGPRARGDRVCRASVVGARGSAEPFDLSQCGDGFDVLHAWEGADVLSQVSVEVAGVAGDGGGDHVVRPRVGRREADGCVAGEGGPDVVQAGRVHAKPEV